MEPIKTWLDSDINDLCIEWNKDIIISMPKEYFFDINAWVHEICEMVLHFYLLNFYSANRKTYVVYEDNYASANLLAHFIVGLHTKTGRRAYKSNGEYDDITTNDDRVFRFMTVDEIVKFKNFLADNEGEVNDDEN